MIRLNCLVSLFLLASLLPAQETPRPTAEELEDRQTRFAYIQQQFESFELRLTDDLSRSLKLTDEPVLKYTNPVRSADGIAANYLWLDNNRPVAAGCVSIRQEEKVFRELVSLSPKAMTLTKAGMPLWTPTACAQPPQEFTETPVAGLSAAQRLIQMRTLARQFSVKMLRDPPVEARLLPQPVHRYADASKGILDGGLFAWVETTDPEALLTIEAILKDKETPATWYFSFARMTSAGLEVRRKDAMVFTADSYWRNPRAKTDPYQEAQQIRYGAEPPPIGK